MPPRNVEIILLKQLASCLAMPMFVLGPDGEMLYFNEPAESIVGARYAEQATFIALCLDEDVRIGDALLEEIEQHAADCGGTIVLAVHYPVEGTCERETTHWVRQSAELKALIAKHGRRGIIVAGHWHSPYFMSPPVTEGNVILCFGGEVSTLSENGNQPWGKVIDCHEDHVTITHRDFVRYRRPIHLGLCHQHGRPLPPERMNSQCPTKNHPETKNVSSTTPR